jgi:hypothetical protein
VFHICHGVVSVVQGLGTLPSSRAATAAKPVRSNPSPAGDTAHSSLQQQQAGAHLLAQLLLVYQWNAALCRIWPSSIPDAKSLSNLLTSAIAGAAQLVRQLPHMQADSSSHTTASEAQRASVDSSIISA